MYLVICCEKFILNFYAIYNQILIIDISIEFFCIDAKRVFLTGLTKKANGYNIKSNPQTGGGKVSPPEEKLKLF